MWTCAFCKQKFVKTNQSHSCGDKVLDNFLKNKSDHTISLFWHFVDSYQLLGNITIHPTKSMIAFAANTRIAYVIRLGKNFVDVVFPFDKPYAENLCFHKIAQVPGSEQYNHHLCLQQPEDINSEVKKFMTIAYKKGL